MFSLFVDCQTGLSGDMLLAALFDLGVPKEIIEIPLKKIGIANSYQMNIKENKSYGIRGKQVEIIDAENIKNIRSWKNIKEMIIHSKLDKSISDKVLSVFKVLAEAEAFVHGCDINDVHFHEIGAIDSLVDIISVCSAIDYLDPKEIICSQPPTGSGTVKTSHGLLPVPVPAVVEIARKFEIELGLGDSSIEPEELTTPTGLALMAILANKFQRPFSFSIDSIGTGIGHRDIKRPNLLRIFKCHLKNDFSSNQIKDSEFQSIVVQETWVDDSSPEDIAYFCNELVDSGAIEVITQSLQMKKNRDGILIRTICKPEDASNLRRIWLSSGITIGFRERIEGRWVLPRRSGVCQTSLGLISVKQVKRPDGRVTIKPEHRELVRLSKETGKSIDAIRKEVYLSEEKFKPDEEWKF